MEEAGRIAIGALSKHTGTNIETIRYYERVALLPAPARSSGGYRLYETDHLKRLNFIRRARSLGFSLAEVRKLLTLSDQRRRPCAEVRAVAAAHLEDVKGKIADLKTMERVLASTIARCQAGSGSHCPMIDALYTNGDRRGRRRGCSARRLTSHGAKAAHPPERERPASARKKKLPVVTTSSPGFTPSRTSNASTIAAPSPTVLYM